MDYIVNVSQQELATLPVLTISAGMWNTFKISVSMPTTGDEVIYLIIKTAAGDIYRSFIASGDYTVDLTEQESMQLRTGDQYCFVRPSNYTNYEGLTIMERISDIGYIRVTPNFNIVGV